MKAAVCMVAALTLSSAAWGQTPTALDFRRADWSPEVPAAIGFTPVATGGSRYATVVARTRTDRPLAGTSGTYRGLVMRAEVRCSERQWRILGIAYYDRDYALVQETPDIAWAPLVRETPLHASISDICESDQAATATLTSDDPVKIQQWLDSGQ